MGVIWLSPKVHPESTQSPPKNHPKSTFSFKIMCDIFIMDNRTGKTKSLKRLSLTFAKVNMVNGSVSLQRISCRTGAILLPEIGSTVTTKLPHQNKERMR